VKDRSQEEYQMKPDAVTTLTDEIVTADGQLRRASRDEHPDL
jgi:hypothetical protein